LSEGAAGLIDAARRRLGCSSSDILCSAEWISRRTSLSFKRSCGELLFAKIAAAISLLSSLEIAMIQESLNDLAEAVIEEGSY
jgi:hypothetical protein